MDLAIISLAVGIQPSEKFCRCS